MSAYYYVSKSSYDSIPSTAVIGGVDKDGSRIYVGRAHHCGDLLPAKIIPSRKIAYVSHGGHEHTKNQFEVLCERRMEWVSSSHGNVPPTAVECGRTSNGEQLYVGRCRHDGTQTTGKVHPSHRCLYIPYGGKEVRYDHYEVLTII